MAGYHNTEPDEQDEDAEDRHGRGFLAKLSHFWLRGGDDEDGYTDEEEDAALGVAPIPAPSRAAGGSSMPLKRSTGALRLETVRNSRVTVRRVVQSIEDTRRAVDGLREGVQQIINFERTPADIAEKLTDFMFGAIYSLDGSVEKIGDKVFLFTPGSVIVSVEEKPATTTQTAFFDKS
jgi:FtsZ-interacting cell division protein YlmF